MKTKIFIITLIHFSIVGCTQHGEVTSVKKEFLLSVSYTNPNGSPSLTYNDKESNKGIIFPSGPNFSGSNCEPKKICLSVNGVTLSDYLGQYTIEDVVIEEYSKTKGWEPDRENKLSYEKSATLDAIVVLDLSYSLGEDVKKVKSNALVFVNKVFSIVSDCRIGVVLFSDSTYLLPLTKDKNKITSFISNGIENQTQTRLYEAIDNGISLLVGSQAASKVLVTFTDGRNNGWSDPYKYKTPDYTLSNLQKSGITSYSIGLEGTSATGVDFEILQSFSINGGRAIKVSNADKLQNAFDRIANSVTQIYSFTYKRNNSIEFDQIPLKFKIYAKLN